MAEAMLGRSTSTSSAPWSASARAAAFTASRTSSVRPAASMSAGTTPTRRPSMGSSRCAAKSHVTGWLVESHGSRPPAVSAFMARATSSTRRPKGPTWSSEEPKATTP